MVEIQQRGIEFLRSVQKVGTSYRALGLAERSSNIVCVYICIIHTYIHVYIIYNTYKCNYTWCGE